MTTKQRANLIRERMRALFPVVLAPRQEPKRKGVEREPPGRWHSSVFGRSLHEAGRRMAWVSRPGAKAAIVPMPSRIARVSALTKITESHARGEYVYRCRHQLPRKG